MHFMTVSMIGSKRKSRTFLSSVQIDTGATRYFPPCTTLNIDPP